MLVKVQDFFLFNFILFTGVIAESNLLNSETEAQTSLPDVPYEPDLDIEIDFPRGIFSVILINVVKYYEIDIWKR